ALPFLPLGYILQAQFVLLLPILTLTLTCSMVVWRSGYVPARFFVLAQAVPLTLGIVTLGAYVVSSDTSPVPREYSIPGNILLVLFTSFALTDRINLLQEEKRTAQQKLEASQALYQRVLEDQPALVCRFLPDGTVTYANPGFAAFFGMPLDDLIGARSYEYMPAQMVAANVARLETMSPESPVMTVDSQLQSAQGAEHWIQWTVRALFSAQGQIEEYQVLGTDVTTTKRAQVELAEYRNQLEDLVVARTEELSHANIHLRRRAEELAALNATTQVLNSSLELDVVLRELLTQLARVLPYESAELFLGEAGALVVAAATQGAAAPVGSPLALPANAPVLRVFGERAPLVLAAPTAATTTQESGESARVRLWMGAPLKVGSEVIGVLAMTTAPADNPRDDMRDEVQLLQAFADQAAVAVLNARLFRQAQTSAVSKERERLARDLHDAVTQTLFSASILAEALPVQWQSDPENALITLEKLRHLTRGALAEMRTLLLELRPSALTEVGLDSLLRHLSEAYSGNTLVPVRLRATPADLRLPADVQILFYRVAQEALNNAAKHAEATSVQIDLQASEDEVTLAITDDGRGFDAAAARPGHLGLVIMRERAATVGATLQVTSSPGQGTHLLLCWQRGAVQATIPPPSLAMPETALATTAAPLQAQTKEIPHV
ncbi:MAG: histidine kinase, partial [Caldilineaceae bacterium]